MKNELEYIDTTNFSTLEKFNKYSEKAIRNGFKLLHNPITASGGFEETTVKVFRKRGKFRVAAYDAEQDVQRASQMLGAIVNGIEMAWGGR